VNGDLAQQSELQAHLFALTASGHDQFSGLIIQHGYVLLSCVQIDAYKFHLGLLRSEQSVVRAPTFYSARCEADFVMPSDGTFPVDFA